MSRADYLDFEKIFYDCPGAFFVCEADEKWTVIKANKAFFAAANLSEQTFGDKFKHSFLKLIQKNSRPDLAEKFNQYLDDLKKKNLTLPFFAKLPIRISEETFLPVQLSVRFVDEENPLLYCILMPTFDGQTPYYDTEDLAVDKVKEGLAAKKLFKDENAEMFVGKKILLAESHPLNLQMTAKMLGRIGFEVITAANGQMAMEKYSEEGSASFFAILIDQKMPLMDGITIAKEIRDLESELAPKDKSLLFVLVNPADQKKEDGHSYDCFDDHLVKPFSIVKLIEKFQDYL